MIPNEEIDQLTEEIRRRHEGIRSRWPQSSSSPPDHMADTCVVDNTRNEARRIPVSSYIDGYSARSTQTYEIGRQMSYEFRQLPTLFLDRARTGTELTRATLNVTVEDLDGRLEMEQTKPVWLLARTTAPLAVRDPKPAIGATCRTTSGLSSRLMCQA